MRIFRILQKLEQLPLQQEKHLSISQLHLICRQVSFALAGGMPLPAALRLVGSEMSRGRAKTFLLQLEQGVQQGASLAQALEQSDIGYSPVLLEFVLAGEQNGTMRETMGQAADYFQQQQQIRQMLFSALFYPAVLCVLMIAAFCAMFFFVVPTVVQTYENFQAELPATTQMLLAASHWLRQNWHLLLMALFLSGCLLFWELHRALQQPQKRERIRRGLLHLPILGKLYQQYWFIQIAQALGLMLSSGMLLLSSLQAAGQIYHRSLFAEELGSFAADVAAGHSFGHGLQRCSFIPKMAGQMLTVSEQSGALPQALLQLSQYYQQQFQHRLQQMIGLLEPCFVIFLGLSILFLASSLFLPLVQSYQYLL